jgi:hypothetical protein
MLGKRDKDVLITGAVVFGGIIVAGFAMREPDKTWQPGPNDVVVTSDQSGEAVLSVADDLLDKAEASRKRPDPDVIETKHLAWIEIQKHVNDALFMGEWKWTSDALDNGDRIVTGAVLERYRSAPPEKVPFAVTLRKNGDQWDILRVSVGNELVVDRSSDESRSEATFNADRPKVAAVQTVEEQKAAVQALIEQRNAQAAKARQDSEKADDDSGASSPGPTDFRKAKEREEREDRERVARARLKHVRNQIEKGTFTDLEEKALNKVIDEYLTLPLGNEAEELLKRGRAL